ncbi:DUF1761 domain-containing protein [Limimaricola sp.]|uniref:DUF1761 domain-containing protein n=1 Tax=Limimaricola sp. TaxID=2211665 RepID=UPI0025BF20C3|nr:DUF1761 domain-containing protein [Limimaricola sp.]
MGALFTNVGWLGVIVGAVASFLLGWVVYLPATFGRKWAEGSHVQLGAASQMPLDAMGAQALGLLLMSWVLAICRAQNLLALGVLATLAFAALAWSGATFSQKSLYARNVDAGYWLASLVVMLVVQALL